MKQDKRGVSSLVATVLLILVSVAAVGLVAAVVLPLIARAMQFNEACMNAKVMIDTTSGYTCYDSSKNQVSVTVSRGSGEFKLAGILLGLKRAGTTASYMIRDGEYAAWTGDLSCEISSECQQDYVDMFHLSNLTNAHAELANQSDYPYKICCKSISVLLSNICSEQNMPIVSLAKGTNAHVSLANLSDYPYGICLDFNSTLYAWECTYETKQECKYSTCVVGLAQQIDSHAASCDEQAYNKLCCDIYNKSLSKKERTYINKWNDKYPIIYGWLPNQNEANTFRIEEENATGASIAPVVRIGLNEKICDVTSKADLPRCA